MRRPASPRGRTAWRGLQANALSIPAPVGGWDAKSALADMPAQNAIILDNWIPRSGYVEFRRGYRQQVTGTSVPVESLMVWRGDPSGEDRLFAAAGADLFDVSTQGASLGAPVVAGLTGARFQHTNFANDAGAFLVAVNGADDPLRYDGSAWTSPPITSAAGPIVLDPSTLADVMAHKRRLFFVERDSLRVWYLGADAVQGEANLLDLGPVFQQGGSLLCEATWSMDGGQGVDDFAVWITTEGEVAVYQGTDPDDVNNWALVGVYSIPKPLGRRCVFKDGADLVVLTVQGALPLSQALNRDRAKDAQIAITDLIKNAFFDAAQRYGTHFGWEAFLYPEGGLAICNVPVAPLQSSVQYVQNAQTGRWCSFSGIDAFCWAIANGSAYFGGREGVYQFDQGSTDDGDPITYDLKSAFQSFGRRATQKKFTLLRPILQSSNVVEPALEMLTDYREAVPTAVPTVVNAPTSVWDSAVWNTSVWSDLDTIRYAWTSVTGIGYVGAPRLRVVLGSATNSFLATGDGDTIVTGDGDWVVTEGGLSFDITGQLIGFDVMFQAGGPL